MASQKGVKTSFSRLGLLGGFFSIIIWSMTPLVVILLKSSANAIPIAFALQLIGFIAASIFTAILWLTKYNMSFLKEIPKKAFKWIFLAGVVESLSYITFYFAIQYGGSMQATVIHYLWPLILIILSQTLITNTSLKLNSYQWALVLLTAIGAYFVLTGTSNLFDIDFKLPILWAFASAILTVRKLLHNDRMETTYGHISTQSAYSGMRSRIGINNTSCD